MSERTGLKYCPFCGGPVQTVRENPSYRITGIFCRSCKALTKWEIDMWPRETYGENEEKWKERLNRRADDE